MNLISRNLNTLLLTYNGSKSICAAAYDCRTDLQAQEAARQLQSLLRIGVWRRGTRVGGERVPSAEGLSAEHGALLHSRTNTGRLETEACTDSESSKAKDLPLPGTAT